MLRIVSWLVSLPIVVIVAVFALENREVVTLSLWPLNLKVELPLSILSVGLFVAGVIFGSFLTWIRTFHHRFQNYKMKREIAALNEKQESMQQTYYEQDGEAPLLDQPQKKKHWFGF